MSDHLATPLAINVEFLFRERPYLERFAAARDAGFEWVEFAWPRVPPDAVVKAVRAAEVRVALLSVAGGDLDAGERGYPNDPAAQDRWRGDVDAALELAAELDCPILNVLAGNRLAAATMTVQLDTFRANLAWALPRARAAGRTLVLELLNPIDNPRYLLTDPARIRALLLAVGDPGLRLRFDAYEFGRVVEDVAAAYREAADLVAHIEVGDVPDRHEPGTGSVDWEAFLRAVHASGYRGAIGLRYLPAGDTLDGLGWVERFGLSRGSGSLGR
jgi:hydroxypyruvate isomerase